MRILGISAFYHDSAAALVEDGIIRAAAQEERFTRVKGDASFPHHAINFCLSAAGVTEAELDYIVFYENPKAKFDRLLTTYHLTAPGGLKSFLSAIPSWITSKLWMASDIARQMGVKKNVQLCDHHMSHAASAFFPSPFEKSAILTIDGVGEWSTTTFGRGEGNQIKLWKQIRFPHSVGLLYSAFTYYTGFKINSGEYKLMGLAPYGRPKYYDLITEKIVKINLDGSILLNQKYFDYLTGLKMVKSEFAKLFGHPARQPETLLTQFEMDVAASIQQVLNDVVMKMANYIHEETGEEYLTMAGGVALNCVANGILSATGPFKKLWIHPAAGDAGGALGCALWFYHQVLGNPRQVNPRDSMRGALLGTDIKPQSEDDDALLRRMNAVWDVMDEKDLAPRMAEAIASGKVLAVSRGPMEFGPRALGSRSILGDARSPKMQTHMNLKIKFRESFRPFAPMVLEEDAAEYFEVKQESPYMLIVSPVLEKHRLPVPKNDLFGIDLLKIPRSKIPAITHVDYSARLQTITRDRTPLIYDTISLFKKSTGCSVIINTSFNVRGEPIVNTAEDAYRCFMATDIDCLVIGNRFLEKERQENRPLSDEDREKWLRRFELD